MLPEVIIRPSNTLNNIQTTLDFIGMYPGAGTLAGLTNAGIDLYRGNYGSAGFNMLSAVPFLGTAMKGTKLAAVGVKAISSFSKMKTMKAALALTYRSMKSIKGMHKHHLVPKQLFTGSDELGEAIRASGFDGNAGEYIKYAETGFHGTHPAYTELVADELRKIMRENGGNLTIQNINSVVNDMGNFVDKAYDNYKATGMNLNDFSKQMK